MVVLCVCVRVGWSASCLHRYPVQQGRLITCRLNCFSRTCAAPLLPATSWVPPALALVQPRAAVVLHPDQTLLQPSAACCRQIAGAVLTVLSVTVYMAYQYRLSVQQAPQKEAAEEATPAAEASAAAAAAAGGGGRPLGATGAE